MVISSNSCEIINKDLDAASDLPFVACIDQAPFSLSFRLPVCIVPAWLGAAFPTKKSSCLFGAHNDQRCTALKGRYLSCDPPPTRGKVGLAYGFLVSLLNTHAIGFE